MHWFDQQKKSKMIETCEKMIEASETLYTNNKNQNEGMVEFLKQYRRALLHCDDKIIESIHELLDFLKSKDTSGKTGNEAFSEIIIRMRKSFFPRTNIKRDDIRHVTPRSDLENLE
jgi:hypothetical protein